MGKQKAKLKRKAIYRQWLQKDEKIKKDECMLIMKRHPPKVKAEQNTRETGDGLNGNHER